MVLIGLLVISCYQFIATPAAAQSTEGAASIPSPKEMPRDVEALPHQFDYYANFKSYPAPDTFQFENHSFVSEYQTDDYLNERTQTYLKRYKPNVAVYLVADLETGKIISLGERIDEKNSQTPKLTFGKKFPAASLAKVITAFSALRAGTEPQDSLIQIGSYHTLYKRQLETEGKASHPKVTLKKAFAKSINPAFGVLGQRLGPQVLKSSAEFLGFNRKNLPLAQAPSEYNTPTTDYQTAEYACGFTQSITISPLHALELARSIGGDGEIKPILFSSHLQSLEDESQKIDITPAYESTFFKTQELKYLQAMMEETTERGTGRKGFHQIMRRHHLDQLITGAKTGSLDGNDPKGRYDWFMGYAKLKEDPSKGIAVVVMQVHQTYQSLLSTRIAALLIKDWLKNQPEPKQIAHKTEEIPVHLSSIR